MTKFSHLLWLLLMAAVPAFGQSDYYWVGGSGNWSDVTHWATTSGGSTTHSVAPTQGDNVYFDANSFSSGGQVVTLDVNGYCNDMSWDGVSNFPTLRENANLYIYGSLILSPDVSYDLNIVEFWATDAGNTVTSNGNSLGSSANVRFQGTGEWTFNDNFESSYLYHQNGTLNTDGHTLTIDRFNFTGSSARTINLGNSTIEAERWTVNGFNITINAGTSTIRSRRFIADQNGDGPFTYNNVTLYGSGILENTCSINTLTLEQEASIVLESGATFTVSSLDITGTKFALIELSASSAGSEATFSKPSGTVDASFVSFTDIHATGGATFNADQSIDDGNNTGWNITAISGGDYYWVGNGGNWSDPSHWATTSGGPTNHGDYPGKFDDVYFDANSFSSSLQTVSIDIKGAQCHDMDWTGVTNNPTIESDYTYDPDIYGSATFTPNVTKDFYGIDFVSSEAGNTITWSTGGNRAYMSFSGEGEYTLQDSLYCATISISKGILNLNDQPVSCSIDFSIEGFYGADISMGAANIYARDWYVNNPGSLIFDAGTSTINVTRNFDGEGLTYHNAYIDGTSDITGENTFSTLEASPGSDLTFEAGATQTITTDLILTGTKANPITIASTIGGAQATLSKSSGAVDATYLVLQDSEATGGATFNATETIDNGNNTDWNISGLTGSDFYWVGNSGDWSDYANHWATTSGGSTFHTESPGVLDNVIFDANSFSANDEVVTIDNSEINFHDMDWSAIDQSVILYGYGKTMNIYGSLTFSSDVLVSVSTFNFLSSDAEIIDTYGETGNNSTVNINGSGSWTLQSALTASDLNVLKGTFNTNNHEINVTSSLTTSTTNTKSLDFGTSTAFARALTINGENTTFDASGATFSLSSSLTSGSDNTGNNITFGDITAIQYNATDELRINDDVTVANMSIDPGVILEFGGSVTLTLTSLTATGTVDDNITIRSKTEGDQGIISMASGTVDGEYLILQDNLAIGGATFNAYNSINDGNVSGWTFHKLDQTLTFDPITDKSFDDVSFELSATATSGLDVTFSVVSGPITISGTTVTITGTGLAKIQASQAGDINYNPAASIIREFTINNAAQTITFDAIADKTFGEAAFNISATASSGLDVTLTVISGPVTLDGNTVTITGVGIAEIEATQDGNGNYSAATPVSQTFTISKASQTITFDAIADKTFGEAAFNTSATASSSLDVTLTVISGPVTLDGNTVTITGAGTAEIEATQGGNDNYNAATPVSQTFTINKASQTITFEALSDITLGDVANVPLVATASSGLTVSFSVSGPASISGTDLIPEGSGEVTVTASQSGNDNYLAATDVEQIILIIDDEVTGLPSSQKPTLTVYPQPANNRLYIEQKQSKYKALILYSTNGAKIFESDFDSRAEIKTETLKRGVYILELIGKSENKRIKVILNR